MSVTRESGPAAKRPPEQKDDLSAFLRRESDGQASLHLLVHDVHCARCISTIENAMRAEPGVLDARVNLSTRRLLLRLKTCDARPGILMERLETLGYRPVPYDPSILSLRDRGENALLLRSLAVSGFAAGNVMLLSVAVWAGAFSDMEGPTRSLMHWTSALIALPAITYGGRPFFRSAARAIAARRLNMDVPISIAVIVTAGISLFELLMDGRHVYFDAAVMLLFFLLIGRYLDFRTRGAMNSTAENLAALSTRPATVVSGEGSRTRVPARNVGIGTVVLVAAGERIPVDGVILSGRTQIDRSLLTGESLAEVVVPGDSVFAGTVNTGDPITVRATATGDATLLTEIVRLVQAAEQGRSAYVRLADRAARLYAPLVHATAAMTFLGWWFVGGSSLHEALLTAVGVLIITCPCALGLAVPAVQVVACNRLLRSGILVKTGDALERLAGIDTVVFDKTGTLTLGRPDVMNRDQLTDEDWSTAASLAAASRHPLCRAIVRSSGPFAVRNNVKEEPAMGLAAATSEGEIRLGNRDWCNTRASEPAENVSELWLRRPGRQPVRFLLSDGPRPDLQQFMGWLRAQQFLPIVLSGDRIEAVREVAEHLKITDWTGEARPAEKFARLNALRSSGRRVLMVGDGLNDAPALAAATVSISPATGSDVTQTAADIVFQGDRLEGVALAITTARRTKRLILQNFGLAALYNALAIPLAIAGFVTPLVAAVAMSASSLAVTLNALRLARYGRPPYE